MFEHQIRVTRTKLQAVAAAAVLCLMTFTAALPAAPADAKKADKAVEKAGPPSTVAYPLATCIVSGEKLGEMGEPVTKMYDGREVKFCCAACPKKFEEKKVEFMKKLDDAIIAQQKPHYPTTVCVQSDEKLGGDMGDPIDYVVGNRYVELCCKSCVKDLQKDPAKYIGKLDAAVIEKESKNYPLDTCIVSDMKLGSMGKPVDTIFAGRLVRLCSEADLKKFQEHPEKYMEKLEAAWKAKK